MSRITKLPVEAWDPELVRLTGADKATPLEQGTMRMMAHRPELAKGFAQFAGAMFSNRLLPERLTELVRLRIAYHNQCRSCMAIRYQRAVEAGIDETLVCSLERPYEAPDLSPAERAALVYADLFATDHLAIDDEMFEDLRQHFSEPELVELGMFVALCVGFGRLGAVWDMVEELPAEYQERTGSKITPWSGVPVLVR